MRKITPAVILGRNIRFRRIERKLSMAKLAEKLEIGIGYMSDIERGYKTPNVFRIHQIAKLLKTNVEFLIENNSN